MQIFKWQKAWQSRWCAQQNIPLQHNITGKGHESFAQKGVYFLSPVCLHGRYTAFWGMDFNGAIG